jgi:hypothetical protein
VRGRTQIQIFEMSPAPFIWAVVTAFLWLAPAIVGAVVITRRQRSWIRAAHTYHTGRLWQIRTLAIAFAAGAILLTSCAEDSGHLFPAGANGKLGYMSRSGEMVIPADYDWAARFSEGLAAVVTDGIFSFIDVSGTVVFTLPAGTTPGLSSRFSEKRLAVEQEGRWGYVDVHGSMVIPATFDSALAFSEGLACVGLSDGSGNTSYGYIDRAGEMVIRPQFAEAQSFSSGLAAVAVIDARSATGTFVGYINRKGKWVIEPRFPSHGFPFQEGLALAATVEGDRTVRQGYIDRRGGFAILLPTYRDSQDTGQALVVPQEGFSEGLAPVTVGNKCGYVDQQGNWVIEPQFVRGSRFSDGLAAVATSGDFGSPVNWGYIDKTGATVISPQFSNAQPFEDGLALVERGRGGDQGASRTILYINKSGQVIREWAP